MSINKSISISIAICCFVASLWSEAQSMDNQYSVVEKIYDNAAYSSGVFRHSRDGTNTLSTLPQQAQKPYHQKSFIHSRTPQELKQEKILKVIIPGQDGRTRVAKTTEWPYTIYTQLSMVFAGQEYGGSGTIVGPHHVLTCAHNVYDNDQNIWAEKILAYPALNDNDAPFGEVKVTKVYTFNGWINQKDQTLDMALLVLNKSIGEHTGWGGLLSLDDVTLAQEKVNITGYPGDKGLKQMWTMCHTIKTVKSEQFDYEIDTYGGQSGSPIWINKWGMPMILGVHTLGNNTINSGVRLSAKKFTDLLVKVISDTYAMNTDLLPSIPIQPSTIPSPVPSFATGPISNISQPALPKILTQQDAAEALKQAISKMLPIKEFAEILKNDTRLTDLGGLGYNIGDGEAQWIAKALETNKTVTRLCLGWNKISEEDTKALANTLRTNKTLTWLSLPRCSIKALEVQWIAKALETNVTLTVLTLASNEIGDEGAKYIAKALQLNKGITQLILSDNKITNKGASAIAKSLETNSSLTDHLSLSGNNISDDGAKDFAIALEKNRTLRILSLDSNKIGEEGKKILEKKRGQLTLYY